MFVQDVICPSVSCATCNWCFDPGLPHVYCLRQMASVSFDPLAVVCPLWSDSSIFDLQFSDIGIQYPTKSRELASA